MPRSIVAFNDCLFKSLVSVIILFFSTTGKIYTNKFCTYCLSLLFLTINPLSSSLLALISFSSSMTLLLSLLMFSLLLVIFKLVYFLNYFIYDSCVVSYSLYESLSLTVNSPSFLNFSICCLSS